MAIEKGYTNGFCQQPTMLEWTFGERFHFIQLLFDS
jgi:hypothetical protein